MRSSEAALRAAAPPGAPSGQDKSPLLVPRLNIIRAFVVRRTRNATSFVVIAARGWCETSTLSRLRVDMSTVHYVSLNDELIPR